MLSHVEAGDLEPGDGVFEAAALEYSARDALEPCLDRLAPQTRALELAEGISAYARVQVGQRTQKRQRFSQSAPNRVSPPS